MRGDQLFLFTVAVGRNELISFFENIRCGPEVFFQLYNDGFGPILFKGENVFDIGPPPTINGLIRVAGHTDVMMSQCDSFGDLVLGVVGILIFINQQITEPVTQLFSNIGPIPQQESGVHQQIVKIEGVVLFQYLLI